jgi:hypothetical protein
MIGSGTDSGNSSPVQRPVDSKTPDFNLPQIPQVSDTPGSSGPSTPRDDRAPMGHRRTDSITIEGEDYFMGLPKLNGAVESKSLPGTPQNMAKYNVSFSPRLQFHDTWPSLEYDRRGEIATCNRLTPMLAQQIKEELNTFKMVRDISPRDTHSSFVYRKWKSTSNPKSILTFSKTISPTPSFTFTFTTDSV